MYTGVATLDQPMNVNPFLYFSNSTPASPLTERELEIIALSLSPMSRKEIAAHLSIGETDVRRHLVAIQDKLGISDRLNLIIYAYTHDLDIEDSGNKSKALAALGDVYLLQGKSGYALECFEEQLEVTRTINDRDMEGEALCNIGRAYENLGEQRCAVNYYEQSLALARQLGNRCAEGAVLCRLGAAYTAAGYARHAVQCSERSVSIFRETKNTRGEGKALLNLSLALDKLGARCQAITIIEEAVKILEGIKSRDARIARDQLARWRGKTNEKLFSTTTKQCPYCKRCVRMKAKHCMHCGSNLQ